jgi:IclR family KDG regulon transcriptional repressor
MATTITPDRSQIPARQIDDAAQASRDVVEKAFRLLEAWSHHSEVLGGSEVARRSGLPKTTAYRLIGMLDSAAVIERVVGGYRIGDRLHGFTGLLAPSHRPELREATLPFLQDLYVLTHETVHLAVLDGSDVRCVEKLYGHRRSPLVSSVGGLLPVDSTALGKVLLAYSPAERSGAC